MNVLTTIRTNEWWEYKFPPILAIGYMVILHSGHTFAEMSPVLIISLLSLINGAAFVSVLNDATDIADDAVAGKKNRMADAGNVKKLFLIAIPLLVGACFVFYYATDITTMLLYMACYLSFIFYSLPPFRLKKRGLSGLIADAAGSQLFPTLFFAVFLFFKIQQPINHYQLTGIGIWSFCFGLRGILWHQFLDQKKDLVSGTKTIVHRMSNKAITVTGVILISIEIGAFAVLLFTFKLLLPAVIFICYLFYLLALYKNWKIHTIIIKPVDGSYRIMMNEYYQAILPLSILLSVVFAQPSVLMIVTFHVALFPVNTVRIVKEFWLLVVSAISHRLSAIRRKVILSKLPPDSRKPIADS